MECLKAIQKSVERCQEMADVWRDLGQREPSRMKTCLVRELVADSVEYIKSASRKAGVEISVLPGEDNAAMVADATQFHRALQNVLQNAILASAEGGGHVHVGWEVRNGNVEISISDDGGGIPENVLPQVCEPCFTTRRQAGGTGLGLFITRMVVEGTHGGRFTIGNNPAGGATAVLQVPLAQDAAA
jgi:signal transduction histidine kinase